MQVTRRSKRFGLLVTAASFAGAAAFAAAPPAGERIGNQATATYTNSAGDTVRVTSNKVETIVQQIAALTVLADTSKSATPGGKVFIPHTITNNGNGADSFTLTTVSPAGAAPAFAFDPATIKIFADADGDGVADSTTPITVTPSLLAGDSYGVIIEAVVPTNANADETDTIVLTATSVFDGNQSAQNTDTVTVSSAAITEVQKSMTIADTDNDGLVGPGDVVTVTLTYSSTGLTDADQLIVTDALDPSLVYVTGSGRWSDDPDALVGNVGDATDPTNTTYEQTNGSGHGIEYSVTGNTVTFQVETVPSGRTGFVTFNATIGANTSAGPITNVASQTVGTTPVAGPDSNTAIVTVDDLYRITAADYAATTYGDDPDGNADPALDGNLDTGGVKSDADDDNNANDVIEVTDAVAQGATIPMEVILTNNGNSDQNISVSYTNDAVNGFPVGTSFLLVGPDGVTPVAGPVGSVAVGESTSVTLLATLPSGTTAVPLGGFNATVSAVSTNGGTPNTATTRFNGTIVTATVDLSNQNGKGAGVGNDTGDIDDNGAPFDTVATDPGAPVSFPLVVENNGPSSDNYDLSLAGLPEGYTVVFTRNGVPVTNTGTIGTGQSADIIATITPPANAPAVTTSFTTSVTSNATGQSDSVLNAVTVNSKPNLRIEADENRQAAPAGIIDIPHVLTNYGNTAITNAAVSVSGFTNFSGTIFHDVNGDGIADAGDVVIDNVDDILVGGVTGVPVGETRQIILRVQVPSSATIGAIESGTLLVDAADGNAADNSVVDTVEVVSGDVSLNKVQRLADCTTGAATGGSTYTPGTVNAIPGACITYRITALNSGTANAGTVTITDATPTWTTVTNCGGSCEASATADTAKPGTLDPVTYGGSATLRAAFGTLAPGERGVMTFTVKIDQ